jgi:hypothetical protein
MGSGGPDYPPTCFNGVIDPGEECDCGPAGCDINGWTCLTFGYVNGGMLYCSDCLIKSDQCW